MILPIRRAKSRLLPRCNENYVVIFILEITLVLNLPSNIMSGSMTIIKKLYNPFIFAYLREFYSGYAPGHDITLEFSKSNL
jgi:hypothetical protein